MQKCRAGAHTPLRRCAWTGCLPPAIREGGGGAVQHIHLTPILTLTLTLCLSLCLTLTHVFAVLGSAGLTDVTMPFFYA